MENMATFVYFRPIETTSNLRYFLRYLKNSLKKYRKNAPE